LGLTSWAIRENQLLSESVGINILKYQLLTFVIACFFTGLTGSVYAHFMGFISPSSFTFGQMLSLLVWVVVGGLNHFIGPITGVIVLRGIGEIFGGLREYEMILNSLILVLVILFLPNGLYGVPSRFKTVFSNLVNFVKRTHRFAN
jgi:branched-chain amino acid transport system permease protein